jgi:hypothetical protein
VSPGSAESDSDGSRRAPPEAAPTLLACGHGQRSTSPWPPLSLPTHVRPSATVPSRRVRHAARTPSAKATATQPTTEPNRNAWSTRSRRVGAPDSRTAIRPRKATRSRSTSLSSISMLSRCGPTRQRIATGPATSDRTLHPACDVRGSIRGKRVRRLVDARPSRHPACPPRPAQDGAVHGSSEPSAYLRLSFAQGRTCWPWQTSGRTGHASPQHVSRLPVGSIILGSVFLIAGGLRGLAPLIAARVVNAVRIWPPPERLSADVIRSCRIVGFLIAALGLAVLMPSLT